MKRIAYQENSADEFGIPKDAELAKEFKGYTEKPEDAPEGNVIESFSIKVATKDPETDAVTVHFEAAKYPFGYRKVGSLVGVVEALDGDLTDEQATFLTSALAGDANGKAVQKIVEIFNGYTRGNAKQAAYARLTNLYTPLSDEKRASKVESMISTFMTLAKVSREQAMNQLKAMQPDLFK